MFGEMGKKAIRYAVVDAFAAEPFKGNPAAVCLLEEEGASATVDDRWMQSVAAEFNLSETAFLARDSSGAAGAAPRFHLRWFTPVTEVDLCGHATLASAHFLFTTVLPEHGKLEFMTRSGILTAKKVPAPGSTGVPGEEQGKLFIELDFPMIGFLECNEMLSIPETLNGAPIVSVHKSATDGDLIVPSP
uniref:Isomerase n=1 Tax=Aegilops tauschii subsp. strangulata TaxID=200361 RepID=A0A453EP79_AEGTS